MNMSIDFLSSLYRLDMASFEELFDSIETIVGENDVKPENENIEEFKNFLSSGTLSSSFLATKSTLAGNMLYNIIASR